MKDRTDEVATALKKEGFTSVFKDTLEVRRASGLPAHGAHSCSHCGRLVNSEEFMLEFVCDSGRIAVCVDRPACQLRRRDRKEKRIATLKAVIL